MAETNHLNMRELLLGRPTRLRYIVRFSICPRTHDESVAEHSYYTALIAMHLGIELGMKGLMIDMGKLAYRALIHDMDEAYSGDMIRMFKHSSQNVKNAIDTAASFFMGQYSRELIGDESIVNAWSQAKDDTLEGAIVSLSDYLSVLSYVVQEILSGNHVMFEHLDDLRKFHDTFFTPKYKELWPYVEEAGNVLNSVEDRRVKL